MRADVEAAKRLLVDHGFIVVPKERVRTLTTTAALSDYLVQHSREVAAKAFDFVKRRMFTDMCLELANHITVVERADDAMAATHFTAKVDIILPE